MSQLTLSDLPPEFLTNEKPDAEQVRKLMLHVGRTTGAYRLAALEALDVLNRRLENNGEKLCAVALILGAMTTREVPGMRDMLREIVPALAAELTKGD